MGARRRGPERLPGEREWVAHRQQGAPGPTHENLGVPEALEEGPVSEGLGWWPETLQRNMEIFLVAFEVKVPYLKKKKVEKRKKKVFSFILF